MSQPAQYGQRIWDDATYGTLSSDGSLVFVIEELPLGVGGPNDGFIMFGGGRNDPSNRGITNKLAAYDIQYRQACNGSWAARNALEQSDTFFLGPPLPLRGQLYVMAEIKDEMRLLALDAATGKLLWSQQLAMVESNITQDPVRRLAGVSPSYSDGVLICPTGAGCVVAVDLATRSLLWGYIYSHPGEPTTGRPRCGRNPIQNAFYNSNGPVPRWLDGTATIVNGRVLLTPAEADRAVLPEPGRRQARLGQARSPRTASSRALLHRLRTQGGGRAGRPQRDRRHQPGRRQQGLGRPHHQHALRGRCLRPRLLCRRAILRAAQQRRGDGRRSGVGQGHWRPPSPAAVPCPATWSAIAAG